MKGGGFWSRLVLSKGKIGPKSRITIPRMELNGAVVNKRLTDFVLQAITRKFGKVLHLVDSSTVLGYLHKEDQKLKLFEGVQVAEIQAAGEFKDGLLQDWAWVEGNVNPANWLMKPRSVKELVADGFWQRGPEFLRMEFKNWPIRTTFRLDRLDGELSPTKEVVSKVMLCRSTEDCLWKLLQKKSHLESQQY